MTGLWQDFFCSTNNCDQIEHKTGVLMNQVRAFFKVDTRTYHTVTTLSYLGILGT